MSLKIENTQVFGFEAAIRAMRNPINSWSKSDSFIQHSAIAEMRNHNIEGFVLGDKDAKLSRTLSKAGSDHRKHLRLIRVWADMTLPRYIWAEMDTYRFIDKVSCSTMHTLMKSDIDSYDFDVKNVPAALIDKINTYITLYKDTKDHEEKRDYLMAVKNILPEGFLQKRTISTNYECLLSMYCQRRNHRLPHWQKICDWILSLPYFVELTGVEYDET